MTELLPTAIDGEAAAIISDLAGRAVLPVKVEDGGLYAVINADGAVAIAETPGYTDTHEDERADRPRRIHRSVTLLDADSFLDYLTTNMIAGPDDKMTLDYLHGSGALELWADLDGRRILAILDGVAGWRANLATLKLSTSREWGEWAAIDGKMLSQGEFAEFIEDHLSTIGEPAGGVLLDICQTLEAKTNVAFKSQTILANGQRQFVYEETVEAKAGQKGSLSIPTDLTLVLRPFQGSDPQTVAARFRFSLSEGRLRLGVKLSEPDRVLEDAFAEVVADVQALAPVRVNYGRP